MNINLKSCPFCGGQGKIMIPTRRYLTFYVVMCEECQSRANEFPDKEMAVDAWNSRPKALEYKGHYRCPNCDTYNEAWEKRENTVVNDTVFCWHCGTKVKLERNEENGK